MESSIALPAFEVKPERTHHRELIYSEWHRRNLPKWCYTMDLDWIAWRDQRGIVAFIETKRGPCSLTEWSGFEILVLRELVKRTGIPAYLVQYFVENEKIVSFDVFNLQSRRTIHLSEAEYKEWIEQL